MSKFIVLSVDHDQQQAFVDFAEAGSRDAALETVLKYRDDCCRGVAYTAAELREIADRSETDSVNFFEEVP